MLLSILSIPIFLLLCNYTPVVHGICNETEISCYIGTPSYCTIRASNGTRTSYLIGKCSGKLAETGKTFIIFYVYLTENSETITLDIAGGITSFYLYARDTISIEFNKTQIDIQSLLLYAFNPAVLYCHSYDFLNYFPSVTYLYVQNVVFDRFPYLNSTSLTELYLSNLTLPNVVTILPSILILPNLEMLRLYQLEDAQWYHILPTSFDNNTRIAVLYLEGIQHLYSYQFANLILLTSLQLSKFITNFTFEDNALSGLDGLTTLSTLYMQTDLDLVSKETFPSLTQFTLSYSSVTTLEEGYFARQKQLFTVIGYSVPFHCNCEMAWVSHVANNLGWTVTGRCETPSSINGNLIRDSSNYINCSIQSYHCFNDTFICPLESICVNTANSAYCDCGDGYILNATKNICVDTNECTGTNNCDHNCTNNIGSYTCSCFSGFSLNPPHSCEDTNECSIPNKCEHNCANTVGSYTCSCMSGFTLQSDMSSCVSGVSQLTAPILLALLSLLLQTTLI